MLDAARARFRTDPKISVIDHNLDHPLPALGQFDAVVSSFSIHHCTDERKKSLYTEIYKLLTPCGVFYNLEHVSAGSPELHARFLRALNITPADEDPSNKCLPVATQLTWLREIGFQDGGLPLEMAGARTFWWSEAVTKSFPNCVGVLNLRFPIKV